MSIFLYGILPVRTVKAGTTPYDFSVPGNYTLGDSVQTEVTANQARLKSLQYTGAEANTVALYHMDSTSGNTATDSSVNANNGTFSTTSPATGGAWAAGKVVDPTLNRATYGSTSMAGIPNALSAPDSPSLSVTGNMTLEAYTKFPTAFDKTATMSQALLDKGNYKLYFDESDGKLKFEIDDNTSKSWTKKGGADGTIGTDVQTKDGLNGSWQQVTPMAIYSMAIYNSKLYVGTGGSLGGMAEVWRYDSATCTTCWTKIGGDALSGSWDAINYEQVMSMAVFNSRLYVGLGISAADAEVYEYDSSRGTPWDKVGGDGTNNSWIAGNNIAEVLTMTSDASYLYVGTGGTTAGMADIWRYNGTNWGSNTGANYYLNSIGGSTNNASPVVINSSWATATYERVRSMVMIGTSLYVGLGDTAGDAEVWRCTSCNGASPTWGGAALGGDGLNSSWANTTYEWVASLTTDGTNVYAGLGGTGTNGANPACRANEDGEVWKFNGTNWGGAAIGGDTADSWDCGASVSYETVRGLAYVGTKLYASVGDTAGDAEVYRYSGSGTAWTKIAGDGVNASWDAAWTPGGAGTTNSKDQVYLGANGSAVVALTMSGTNGRAEVWSCASCDTSPVWTWTGGRDYKSWGSMQLAQVQAYALNDGKLYVGLGSNSASFSKQAVVFEYNGTTWSQVGGGNLNLASGGWEFYENIRSMTSYKGDLYVGMGDTAQDADVWKYSGGAWTQIGGDGLNNSWTAANNIEEVSAMTSDDTYLYVGLGNSASDADVWRWNGTNWGASSGATYYLNAIGGTRNDNNSNLNSSWGAQTVFERINSMTIYNGLVYVALGGTGTLAAAPGCQTNTDSEIWRWNGSAWTKIAGDAVNSTWNCSTTVAVESVRSLAFVGTTLYAGLGDTNDAVNDADADVWSCSNCADTGATPLWTKIGGDNVNSSWDVLVYEQVLSLTGYNGELYAALGNTAGDAEIWKWNGSVWSQVGGDAVGSSFSINYENVSALATYGGRLLAGTGATIGGNSQSDAEVWSYGDSEHVVSTTTASWSQNTWRHVAATYDGTSAKIFVDGVQDGATGTFSVSLADGSLPLTIGGLKNPAAPNLPAVGFTGYIDELRISNTARAANTFVLNQYATTAKTVQPSTALNRTQKQSWNGFDATEIANGGAVTYRLSSDGGTTWKYWNGSIWTTSSSTSQANPKAVINTNIPTFDPAPIESAGLVWQAILTGNGDQQVIVDDASVSYINDTVAPNNVSAVTGNDGNWFDRSNPSFSWSAPTDNADTGNGEVASGIDGYYVYFGTNAAADPATDGVFQTGTSYTGSAIPGGDTAPYYFRIKTRDNAQNVSAVTYDQFRDTTIPNDVATVTGNGNSGNWFLRTNPVISWTAPTDPVGGGGEIASGIKGYYVYFGTNNTADPTVTSGTLNPGGAVKFVTSLTVTAPPLDASDTNIYYFRIRAMDKALNLSSSVYSAFIDTTSPNAVASVTGNNGTWFDRSNPQFSWSAPTDVAGPGEKASGIFGYYVYFGTNGSAVPKDDGVFTSSTSYSGTPIANSNQYFFRIQSADRNFNVSTVYDAFRDTVAPANVTTVTGNNGNWFDRANPQFTWTEPADSAGGGEQVSGINGYFVYFGTNASAVPRTAGTFVTGTTYSGTPISPSDTQQYYFRIQTRDNAMNVTADVGGILNAFHDTTPPNTVTSVTGNSGNWYDRANPQFSWSAATDGTPGGGEVASGINGYFVYFGTNPAAVPSVSGTFITGTTYSPTAISGSDSQTYYFRIQTRDNAMNLSGVYDQFRDTNAPNNIASVTALSANAGTPISTNTWYNYASPEFSWSAPSDDVPIPNTNTEVASGVGGYYVYFGTTINANPATSGTFQTGTTFIPTNLVSGSTYYLRIQTRDKALNGSSTVLDAFTFKFDNVGPTGPTVSASPAGFTAVNNFTFFWLNAGSGGPVDPGAPTNGSGLPSPATFIYRVGSQIWLPVPTTDTQVTIPNAAYQEGANVFEIKALDNVGNEGPASSVTFYYSGSAPTAPENLTVTPATTAGTPSTSNSFSFAWDPPLSSVSPIKQYRFSVNKMPTANNTTITPFRTLSAAPYATQQGKNTFYVIAEDEAGNINYDNPAEVNFYTLTPAPAPPTSLQIFDISNRDTAEYAISMKWTEPVKANGFDGYEVFRSADNITFTSAGTTKSPVFIDTNLESKIYYYKARSKDNAGQSSIDSTVVSLTPTGRFTSPPKIIGVPEVTTKSFSAEIDWTTDRSGSSFIEFGPDPYHLGKQAGGDTIGTLDLVAQHKVGLKGLNPETVYSYQTVWVDQDGNRGQSDVLSFKTGLRPKISDVTIKDVSLSGATISWTSTTVSTSTINYGKTKAFGQSIADVSSGGTTKHTLRLENLSDSSPYYFVIVGKDLDDNVLSSDEYTFTTLTRPAISLFKYETVKDAPTTSIKFTWTTNVPTTTIISVGKQGTTPKIQSDSEYVTTHETTVSGLVDLTPYSLQAKGVDKFGNSASSNVEVFTTPDDSRPPKIINLTVEVRSSGAGSIQKAQLVINWETDEPGTSQVEYGPGISSDTYPSRTQEDPSLTTTHVVIVPELEPAKLYHLRAVSRDRANNAGTSSDTTSITGKVNKSVVDIIISSLTRSLGFLSAIPGLGGK